MTLLRAALGAARRTWRRWDVRVHEALAARWLARDDAATHARQERELRDLARRQAEVEEQVRLLRLKYEAAGKSRQPGALA